MRLRHQSAIDVVAFLGMQNINISIAGISKRFHFASLHYIFFCIPAYTHQIPNGISSHLLRDNMYIISYI